MTDVKFEQQWSNKQLQKLLDTEHIRQHLIEVGLIDRFGEIVSKEEYERLRRRQSRQGRILQRQTFTSRLSTTIESKHQTKSTISPLKQRNKSPQHLSSPHPSIRPKSISVQRTNHPPIVSNNDQHRCIVTIIYYGPQTTMEYTRSWFESEGDEIVVMQQHCGGENIMVYKGPLKVNEIFRFQSRRHQDYPFALAFYINGLIDNRLSICCESRYKHNVRIGGKRGSFGIINVEKSRACRRCRCEQRMKRLEELKMQKLLPRVYEISTPEPNITRSPSTDLSPRSKDSLDQSPINEERSRAHILTGVDIRRENITPSSISPVRKIINPRRRISIEKDRGSATRTRSFQLFRDAATNTTDLL